MSETTAPAVAGPLEAMAASWTDNGEAWEARARLGRKSSNVQGNRPLPAIGEKE